ncbi:MULTISPECIES: alpha/beta fold hydrolase [Subtercola]|uniref:Alpha/beta hydrolase n=1 Tax=Subtercola vilae TaxID=2056433 RepID=A0A4T2BKY8_9MICO|nr:MULTISPECIES: alpha/beta hydrolase [Subtercola]MEA9985029.1 alpha/beta hydrolase [Subtercola sp. RTI3]TIH31212.1 alpha/beta hydrolase [Subtercola vilae]
MSDRQFFELQGRTIEFAAEGKGPALALVVDQGADLDALATLSHLVSQADFRIVRIQTHNAEDVFDILDHLDIASAWIGGHGRGGVTARAAAAAHHERVNGVLLLGVEAHATALPEGIPVLVVQASDDDVTPPANGEALQNSAPGLVSIVTVEGAGHRFPETHAGETAWAIEDYLDWD